MGEGIRMEKQGLGKEGGRIRLGGKELEKEKNKMRRRQEKRNGKGKRKI